MHTHWAPLAQVVDAATVAEALEQAGVTGKGARNPHAGFSHIDEWCSDWEDRIRLVWKKGTGVELAVYTARHVHVGEDQVDFWLRASGSLTDRPGTSYDITATLGNAVVPGLRHSAAPAPPSADWPHLLSAFLRRSSGDLERVLPALAEWPCDQHEAERRLAEICKTTRIAERDRTAIMAEFQMHSSKSLYGLLRSCLHYCGDVKTYRTAQARHNFLKPKGEGRRFIRELWQSFIADLWHAETLTPEGRYVISAFQGRLRLSPSA